MAHDPCTIVHFTHPGHLLVKLNANTEYLCDGCKTLGSGSSFRCITCNFDLHEYCGKCPRSLTSFMHPQHPLSLLVRKEQGTRTNDRGCDVCGESVEGLFYWCKHCNFNVHPLCTQLPQYLRHALHPAHPLTLQASNTVGCCGVCRGVCDSWRYRCGTCRDVDVHLECVLVSCDTRTRQGPIPSPQGYGGYGGGGVAYGWNPYHNNMYNAANYGYGGVASGSSPYNMYNAAYVNYQVPGYNVVYNNCPNQAQGGGATNGRPGKKMYRLVSKLAFGVLTNVIFGFAFPGLN